MTTIMSEEDPGSSGVFFWKILLHRNEQKEVQTSRTVLKVTCRTYILLKENKQDKMEIQGFIQNVLSMFCCG